MLGFCASILLPLDLPSFKQYYSRRAGSMERISVSIIPNRLLFNAHYEKK